MAVLNRNYVYNSIDIPEIIASSIKLGFSNQ